MGCRYSSINGCYSPTCCCCLDVDEACSWVAAMGIMWSGVATLVDFISANLPEQHCLDCLDHDLNAQLSLAAGCINALQWVASVLLLIGAKLGNQWLLLPWLACSVVSLTMQGVWLVFTLRHTFSIRAAASLFQVAWGAHFFLVVKTQYTRLALTFTPPEEVPLTVPPNTPVRKHKRRWRRLHPACQPPIRTLVGVGLRLQRTVNHAKKIKEWKSEREEKQEEEEEEEEEEEIRVTVDSQEGIATRSDEGTCRRRGGGSKAYGDWRTDGEIFEQGVFDVIVHSPYRDVRGRVEERRPIEDKDNDDQDEETHKDEKNEDHVFEDEKKPKDECGGKETENQDEEERKTHKDERKKDAGEDEERRPKDKYKKVANKEDQANGNEESDSGGHCKAIQRVHGEPVTVLWRAFPID